MAINYTRQENDGAGGSRTVQVQLELTETAPGETQRIASRSLPIAAESVTFLEVNDMGASDWHNAPYRQFVVVLSGVVESETSDGAVRRCGPGDVTLVTDIDGKGHRGRIIEAPLHLMFVKTADGEP